MEAKIERSILRAIMRSEHLSLARAVGLRCARVRHIRGLLHIYLAEAERYLDPASTRANDLLVEARELFAA